MNTVRPQNMAAGRTTFDLIRGLSRPGTAHRRVPRCGSVGQRDDEAGAAAGAVLAADAAAVAFGDGLDQRQAEADTAVAFAGAGQAIEGLEDALAQRGGHARTAIVDADLRRVATGCEFDGRFAGAVAARVLKQVADGPAQQAGHA